MKFSEYIDLTEDGKLNHFVERTNRHIKLVEKYINKIIKNFSGYDDLYDRIELHDKTKFENPELEPYVYITWRYKCKEEGIDFPISEDMENRMVDATLHHIKNNKHHPEYHTEQIDDLLNKNDRDKPNSLIDAEKMPNIDIAEMVADWCAMSEERGNTPREWADKNVNIRWKFTEDQTNLIYELIDGVWG